MPQRTPPLQKLMQTDVTVYLAVAVLVLCGVGFVAGVWVALKVLGYAFLGLLLTGMVLLGVHATQTETVQLREVQEEFGGRLRRHRVPVRVSRSLVFEYRGVEARVSLHRNRYSSWMQLTLEWPDRETRLSIGRHGVLSRIGRLAGLQDIPTGSPGFDDACSVRGNDEEAVRELLPRSVQKLITAMPDQKHLGIRIRQGQWQIRSAYWSLETDLPSFVRHGLEIHDGMRSGRAAGVRQRRVSGGA